MWRLRSASLRELRVELQRNISLYAAAVVSMLDEEVPASVDVVLDALRPMVNARARRTRVNGEEAEAVDAPSEPSDPEANQEQS